MSWIASSEAAAILTANSGRKISTDYVRLLANRGFIRSRINPQKTDEKQFWREDVEHRKVRGRTEKYKRAKDEDSEPARATTR